MSDMLDTGDIQGGASQDGGEGRPGLVDLVYGVLFKPAETFRRISAEPPLFHGLVVFATVTVLTSLTGSLIPPDMTGLPPEAAGFLDKAGPFLGIIGVLAAFIGWFIQAGVFQVIAEILGGQGRALGILTLLALAGLPKVLVIPFRIIGYFLRHSFWGRFLTVAVSMIVFVWWVVLMVIGLREVQKLSTGRAAATLFIPAGMTVMVIIVFTALIVGLAAPAL